MELHPDINVSKLRFGRERAPLMVIDSVVSDPDALAGAAVDRMFQPVPRAYPGIRAAAPDAYQRLLVDDLAALLIDFFELPGSALRLPLCHFSLVTLHPDQLSPIQRLPHVDSLGHDGLATVHYLFRAALGGTAFYRHRSTGFEYIDSSREQQYMAALRSEFEGTDGPPPAYINGNTEHFERIEEQEAVFNRMLVYKRNSLHSGSIAPDFVPDSNPATGRLSVNSFIDVVTPD